MPQKANPKTKALSLTPKPKKSAKTAAKSSAKKGSKAKATTKRAT
ncbi:unnamed protein product, partial [Oppiella nova]